METPIQERFIPGLTVKQLAIFVGGIISVIGSSMYQYFSVINKIDNNANKTETAITEIKVLREDIKTLQLNFQTYQNELIVLKTQMNIKNSK